MITFLPVVRLKPTGEKHRLFQKMKHKQHPWFSAFDSILFLLPDAVWNEHLEQQSLQASYNCWGSNYVESVLANLLSHTMLDWIAAKTDLARVAQSVGSPGHPHFCCRCWLFTGTCLNQRFPGFKKDRRDFSGSPVIKNLPCNAAGAGLIPDHSDPTHLRAAKPTCCSHWACTLQSLVPQLWSLCTAVRIRSAQAKTRQNKEINTLV